MINYKMADNIFNRGFLVGMGSACVLIAIAVGYAKLVDFIEPRLLRGVSE